MHVWIIHLGLDLKHGIIENLLIVLSVFFQHTPVVKIGYSFLRLEVHDSLAELEERFSLQWLRKVVRDHVVCRTVFDLKFVILDPVSYKIISDVYVSGSLGSGLLSVVLK